jgi:hypothetical protein
MKTLATYEMNKIYSTKRRWQKLNISSNNFMDIYKWKKELPNNFYFKIPHIRLKNSAQWFWQYC